MPQSGLFDPAGHVAAMSPMPSPISEHDLALSQLNARGYVQFHPLLAERLESHKAAIFIGHALYWTRHLAQIDPIRKGWFYMTARQWEDSTALTTREQTAIRQHLIRLGLVEETLAGKPAKLHFRLKLGRLAEVLDSHGELSWETFARLYQASIRFYKPLADITGSTGAGLYLSYLMQHKLQSCHTHGQSQSFGATSSVTALPLQATGEFQVKTRDVSIALGLGTKAQRNAREKTPGCWTDQRVKVKKQS